jgi:hypothetical protein
MFTSAKIRNSRRNVKEISVIQDGYRKAFKRICTVAKQVLHLAFMIALEKKKNYQEPSKFPKLHLGGCGQ